MSTHNNLQPPAHHSGPFVFHHDAGHGWLAVPVTLIEDLGIAKKITAYSYRSGLTAYLEEDLDAGIFINAYLERFGKGAADWTHFPLTETYDGDISPIRSYPHFYR